MQQRADDVDGGDRDEPAGEGEALDADDAEREIDAEHGAERRPGGGAENVGRDQRIAKEALERRAGDRECRAHQRRRDHARAANQQHDILDRRRDRGCPAGEPRDEDLDELGERDGIASHSERDEEPEREQAQRDDEAWKEAAVHEFQRDRYVLDEYRFNPGPPARARFAHRSALHGRSARKTPASVRANPLGTNPGTGFSQATTGRSTGSPSGGNRPNRTAASGRDARGARARRQPAPRPDRSKHSPRNPGRW